MELKAWKYDELPEFDEDVPGATWFDTTGDEPGVRYVANVEYECVDGVSRVLQILVPASRNTKLARENGAEPSTHPCVVYVQGSAWMQQDVYGNLPCIARLAALGYVVAIVQYRDSSVASFPAPVQDTRNAVRFMRTHAAEYCVDPCRMAVMGDSSGGHTAVYAGIMHDDDTSANLFPGVSAEVSCIVNLYGSTDLTFDDSNPSTSSHNLPESPEGMEMGGINLREDRAARELLSVRCNIDASTSIAPVLTFHGTKDRIVNTRCSVLLHQRLEATGHKSRLYLLRGADHGGPEFWTPEVLGIVDGFLRENFDA
jgi:acetyl esterase/lipase